jgi:hypothetical protein
MSTRRLPALFLVAVTVALFASPAIQAQERKAQIESALKGVLPTDAGTRIEESQSVWAYAAAVVGFIVVFLLAWFFVRVLAFLVIVGCFLGGIALVCAAVHEKSVTTWEQLGVIVLYVGVLAGVAAVTANLYLIKGGMDGKSG